MEEVRSYDQSAAFKGDPELIDLAECAIRKLNEALDLPPLKLTKEVDVAENGVVQLRDRLIERLRLAQPDETKKTELRKTLDRVNVVISLVVGAEYPGAGIHREVIEQARNELNEILKKRLE